MIKKILIANRAEIASRVMKTAKKMGIKTVAIFSNEDKDLPFVKHADESVCLGSGTLAETYLNQELILKIIKDSRADAVHPGYGFLSENSDFCELLEKNKITFIGPDSYAINLMGDKKESKVSMEKISIPLVPGYHGDNQDESALSVEAKKIGFPVLIKAVAGGGGKGMRIVHDESSFLENLSTAKSEAKSAFGNDKVILEKYIVNPRHIEVQVMSDTHGGHFHFFERECSIQRRYQKVIEETPSPVLDEIKRQAICETAVKISAGINYRGAGTIEFIYTQEGDFYFLEMNTRLQVEHPVTEMVTGFDLVELQIRVASGEKLDLKQSEISQTGHSLECRIYAEDPDRDFMPQIGTIQYVGESSYCRHDSSVEDGNVVTTGYDPMISKVITFGSDREDSIELMKASLADLPFLGLKTNREFLGRVLNNERFKRGDIHTHFIEEEKGTLIREESLEDVPYITTVMNVIENDKKPYHMTSWDELSGFRNI